MGDGPAGGESGRLGLDLSAMGGWGGADALPNAAQEWRGGCELERDLDCAGRRDVSFAELRFSDDSDRILEEQNQRCAISDRLARCHSRKANGVQVGRCWRIRSWRSARLPIGKGRSTRAGRSEGKAIKGRGYLELTGYAGRLGEELGR